MQKGGARLKSELRSIELKKTFTLDSECQLQEQDFGTSLIGNEKYKSNDFEPSNVSVSL